MRMRVSRCEHAGGVLVRFLHVCQQPKFIALLVALQNSQLAKAAMEQARAAASGSSLPGGPSAEDRARVSSHG
jgi:hypothetical protein